MSMVIGTITISNWGNHYMVIASGIIILIWYSWCLAMIVTERFHGYGWVDDLSPYNLIIYSVSDSSSIVTTGAGCRIHCLSIAQTDLFLSAAFLEGCDFKTTIKFH